MIQGFEVKFDRGNCFQALPYVN